MCSVFADGELSDQETRKVEEHLEVCEHCRAMSAAFREENRLLVASIQEIDMSEPAVAAAPATASQPVAQLARPKDILKWFGALIGFSALIQIAMSSPDQLALPSVPVNLDWLNPSHISGSLNWLMSTFAYFAGEGVSRMASLADSLSFAALIVLIFAGAVILVRRSISRGAMVAALGLLLVIISSSTGFAMDVRTPGQDKVMTLPAGQTVDDNLFATGDAVIIDGIVNGDLVAFARRVTINGTVKGNVLTGASSIEVTGVVEGSVVAGGQTIQVTGKVAHNVVGFGQSITIGKESTVGGDVAGFGNETHMNGNLGHSFYAFGMADIAGTVGRNATFKGANLSVLPSAHITGDLTSYVPRTENVHVDPNATIGGKQSVELPKPEPSRYGTFGFYFSQLLHVAAAFIAGFLLLLIFPSLRRLGFSDVISVLKSGGIGFLVVFATPIAAICVAITLIGIPVALVGFVTWLLGLYLAKIIVANFIGRTLLASNGDRMSSVALGLFVGLALIFVAINLPYIGGLIHFVLVLIGFGALAVNLYDSFQAVPDSGR
jgi:anti-sigma factor RsiW/cytoskeletal protein CcmA (bactofilin family)